MVARIPLLVAFAVIVACETPSRQATIRERLFWLDNASRQHGFDDAEVAAAVRPGKPLSDKALRKLRERLVAAPQPTPSGAADGLRVLPYPGGRHPRRDFRERALDPDRGTKASLFAPWPESGFAVIDLPEAIWWLPPAVNERSSTQPLPNAAEPELIYLAHTDVPTRWDRLGTPVPHQDWTRHLDGSMTNRRRLPNGFEYEARLGRPNDDGIDLALTLFNGTADPARGLRAQICVMLAGIPEFAGEQSAPERRTVDRGAVAVPNETGDRWFVVVWQHGRADGNNLCPCVHSDPSFPDLAPGESATRFGRVQFQTGGTADAAIRRARARLARVGRR